MTTLISPAILELDKKIEKECQHASNIAFGIWLLTGIFKPSAFFQAYGLYGLNNCKFWEYPAAIRNGLAFEGVQIQTKKLIDLYDKKEEQFRLEHPGTFLDFNNYVHDRATDRGFTFKSLYDQRLGESNLCDASHERYFDTLQELPLDELNVGQDYNIPVSVQVQPREEGCRMAHDYAWLKMVPLSVSTQYPEHRTGGKEFDFHVYSKTEGMANLFDLDDLEQATPVATVRFGYTVRWYSMQCYSDTNREYFSFKHFIHFYN
jgi:hypothetical protein